MTGQQLTFILRMADNALIQGQRLSSLIAEAPELEEEMANANIALDLIGQAELLLDYAARIEGLGHAADDLAMGRDVGGFRNCILVEQPNGDFALNQAKIFFLAAQQAPLYARLSRSSDKQLKAIAGKAQKETAYHVRHARDWIVRLGDGTEESHRRMQAAIDHLWPYTGELIALDEVDHAMAKQDILPDPNGIAPTFKLVVASCLAKAGLREPHGDFMHQGGRTGERHSEHLGYLLAEMQFLHRAYPDAKTW